MNETIRLSPASAAGKPDTDRDKKKYNFVRGVLEMLAGDGLDERSDGNHIIDFVTGEYTGKYEGESDKKYLKRRRGKKEEKPTLFQHVLAGHLSETPIDGSWVYPGYGVFKGRLEGIKKLPAHDPSIEGFKKALINTEWGRQEFANHLKMGLKNIFREAFNKTDRSFPSESNITITKTQDLNNRIQYSVLIPRDMIRRGNRLLGTDKDMILNLERTRGNHDYRVFSFQPADPLPRRY